LRGAERLRGGAMAHAARPAELRTALNLAKAGLKVGRGVPGAMVTLEESELGLLLDAVRFATTEVQWAVRSDADEQRRSAVAAAFPELADKGSWRAFGLSRELDALAVRLAAALNG